MKKRAVVKAERPAVPILICLSILFAISTGVMTALYVTEHSQSGTRQDALRYMDTAATLFEQRRELFDAMADMMEQKKGMAVDYENGVSVPLVREPEKVSFPEGIPEFTQDEQQLVCDFFAGADTERLRMWRVTNSGTEVRFKLYEDGPYRILVIRNPSTEPQTLYPTFERRELGGGWVMLAVDENMPMEEIMALYELE